MDATSRWGLPFPSADRSDAPDVPAHLAALAVALDDHAKDDQGLLADRPVSTVGTPGKRGRYYYATDTGSLFRDTGTSWVEVGRADAVAQPGDLKATARATAPLGWLLCDGALVSRTTYANLFAAIGTAYGAGDGSTTFKIPDLRGRVPVGVDGSAGRLTANDALGQSGGEEKHLLTDTEIANLTQNGGASTLTGVPKGTYGSSGASTRVAHNIMQPFQVVNWVVKI